ncbi:hypothetical protein [Paraburkholderia youngii]|uniref:hypothetical protein n=1 Tax=Paraburkholderia youngii TaxID=2782701 RepID=UPI003D1B97D6
MDHSVDQNLIGDVARDVLMQIAPHEVPLFEATSVAYFANPQNAIKSTRAKASALGFGVDPFSILLTPFVLQVVSEVVPMLGSIAKKATEAAIGEEVSRTVKCMFKRFHDENADPAAVLSHEQLVEIHLSVMDAARKLKLPTDKARALADAVVVQFVVKR